MANTPVFFPGEFHGQWSLVGYSPWGRKELDTTEQLTYMKIIYLKYLRLFNYVMMFQILCDIKLCYDIRAVGYNFERKIYR